ncbi:unnamed protein product [Rotaria magnacalcarata]|nr:unnamed protein product [Rotaria magnacalcarata]CAF3972592.1 unnamed protein product [Rotaria magnacalcarata]CAF4524326.1 unnamed protein product [Rotaria magnacalcarata]CAF4538476.1 unnamed protein product [Rotaria magnacalcarata]
MFDLGSHDDASEDDEDEIERFAKVKLVISNEESVLQWWKNWSINYPTLPRSINLCRTRPFSHNLRPFGMHRITVVLHRAINDWIRSDTEISDHITAVSNRLRQGK